MTKNTSSSPSESALFSRRNALRLAVAAVPVVATFGWSATTANAVGPTTGILNSASRSMAGDAKAARAALVAGTYRPSATTTGPLPGTGFTTIGTSSTAVDFNVTSNNQILKNLYVWGDINLGSFSNVTVQNCVVRGGLSRGPSDKSYIYGQGDNLRGASILDTRIQGRPIVVPATYNGKRVADFGKTSVTNEWRGEAIRGGNYTVLRTEILRTADGIDLTSQLGNVTIEGCWIHQNGYNEWTAADGSDGDGYYIPAANGSLYTHCDAIQFSRGKNYVIRGNALGGTKNGVWAHNSGHWSEIVGCDDMYNSAMMIKQEVDSTEANRIRNVLIEKNWLSGGIATINLPSGRGNDFSDMVIRNNRFVRSNWGSQMYVLTPLSGGRPTLASADPTSWTGNVFDDNGAPITYSRGT